MSNAELSRAISHLVSRASAGEAIDISTQGEALAAQFPGLGMPAELIGKAIVRAAGMVGVVLHGRTEPLAEVEATAPGLPADALVAEAGAAAAQGAPLVPE